MNYRSKLTHHFFLVPLLILTLLFPLVSTAQWTWQHPLPQGNPLFATYFLNPDTGFIAGCEGTILKTTDGGTNWTALNSGTEYNINAISFANENLGLFAGTNGTIGRSTDGGLTWQLISTPITSTLNSICFTSNSECFIAGNDGVTLLSTDGGLNWMYGNVNMDNLHCILVPAGNDVFVFGDNGAFIKKWGGWNLWMNWQINTPLNLYGAYFFDDSTGFVVGGGFNMGFNDIVLKTTNGGETWQEIFTPSETSLYSVYFFNANVGIACGQFQNIMRTIDGGQSWSYTLEYSFENYYQIAGNPDGHATIVGGAGTILRTSDYGEHWKKFSNINTNMNVWPEPRVLKAGYFLDADSGFVVGDKGGLFSTSNGGESWNVRCIDTFAVLNSLQFLQQHTAFINAEDAIFKSSDGGITWTRKVVDSTGIMNAMHFSDINNGYVVGKKSGGSGIIGRTTNSGNTWITSQFNYPSGDFIELYSVFALTDSVVYVSGHSFISGLEKGFIYKSVDAGASFNQVFNIDGHTVLSMDFISETEGFACGTNGLIIHTVNGGSNWTVFTTNLTTNLNAIKAYNEQTLFVCGDNGLILKSLDGGLSWQKQFHACSNLGGLFIFDQNAAWAFGQMETILHTSNGGSNSIDIITKDNKTPNLYCSPNPGQSSTTINFSIENTSVVNISLLDMTGRTLETILHTTQSKGTHSIDFNSHWLSPGLYLIQLRTGNQLFTTKFSKN